MACPPSKVKFQFRRDTLCNWSNGNPLLLAGEPGLEIDTNSFKVGDGVNKWNSLPYIQSPLIFTASGNVRTLTGYKESGQIIRIRSTDLSGNMLNINLAAFTPILSVQGIPSNSLNWDDTSSGFSVSITNPLDYTTEYINAVSSSVAISGIFSELSKFTASLQSTTPAGGVNWTQTFSTNSVGVIRPISTTIAGGTASASISFLAVGSTSNTCSTLVGSSGSVYSPPLVLSINWNTPTTSIRLQTLSGKTFLETYLSASYSLSVTGITNSANYSNSITAVGGDLSSTTGGGVITFTVPIHKNNLNIPRNISTMTTFNRPANVTGTPYTVALNASDNISAVFNYPTFWLFTIGTPSPPTITDIVSGSNFSSNVTTLGNNINSFSGFINNTTGSPKGFWFAVNSAAGQPSSFKTGTTSSLVSDVAVTFGNSVNLSPTPVPSGYVPVSYTLYGITLQNGSSYISIS